MSITAAEKQQQPLETVSPSNKVEIAGGGSWPIALEGLPYIAGAIVLALMVWMILSLWAALPLFAFAAFATWFFRNPKRTVPTDAEAIVSPADGVICQVSEVDEPEYLKTKTTRVSIFMSVVSVHINRAPVAGKVTAARHIPGKFAVASLDKASTENERNAVVLETPRGRSLLFVQIAGSIARRIVCYAKPGDALGMGQRFGLIRFGSRVDVYFPAGCKVDAKVGQRVVGGETILGRWS